MLLISSHNTFSSFSLKKVTDDGAGKMIKLVRYLPYQPEAHIPILVTLIKASCTSVTLVLSGQKQVDPCKGSLTNQDGQISDT